MSFVRVFKIDGRRARFIECECDQCGKSFTKRYHKDFLDSDRLTFCTNKCRVNSSKKGGLANQKYEETCLKKYGVKSPAQSCEIKEKVKQRFQEKYGVDNPFQSEEVKKKIKNSCLKRFGVDHQMRSDVVKEKIKLSCRNRYGVDHQWKSKIIRDKAKISCLKKYGAKYPTQSKEVQEKFKQTCLERYGVENPSQSEDVKKKKKLSYIRRFGVDHPMKCEEIKSKIDFFDISRRRHETMKRNGSYIKSRIEDEFFDYLCKACGKQNVERQKIINNWNIDFYIKSIDLYIQFDGVYWHGLDRPIEDIKEFKNKRDEVIYETYLRDQKQNEWFTKNGLNFIRMTDEEFKKLNNSF